MSDKIISALLLKRKIDTITNPRLKKKFLLDCLKRQGFIKPETRYQDSEDDSEEEKNLCKRCNNDLYYTNNQAICNRCGIIDQNLNINQKGSFTDNLNIGRGTFIQENTVNVKIMKDGKEVIRDLSKVNTWIDKSPEEERLAKAMNFINNILDELEGEYPPIPFQKVRQEIIQMWFLVLMSSSIKGVQKKSLAVWCIYYPIIYNGLKLISIQRLGRMVDVQTGDINKYSWVMKHIFENTKWDKYLSVKIGTDVNLNLDSYMSRRLDRVKNLIKTREEAPLEDKQIYGIIYGIAKKTERRPWNRLSYMSTKTGISETIISQEMKKYKDYY
tara:strand:+ start:2241 stop:3227 length:987 start_codon:yes stop_codon:yes gene_type:complete